MPIEDQYTQEELEEVATVFPEGTVIALENGRVVGMGTGVFIDIEFDNLPPTENQLLYNANDMLIHYPEGRYYYGSDLAVHPECRGRGIAREIYNHRKALVINQGKKGFAAAAVLPGYETFIGQLDIQSYLDKVVAGELFDPTLSVQLRNGFKLIRPIKDFFTYPRSNNWSALILWENPNR